MVEEILINVTPREVRIALLKSGVLQDIYIERYAQQGLVGNIYKGKVSRLLPGIQAAFVDIGLERSAFLHLNDIKAHASPALDIRDLLSPGQEILVQVYKDPLGSKGARLTTQFTVPSRYLVLTPNVYQINVSQKMNDEIERERLLTMIAVGEYGGYIFRTAAEGAVQADIDADKDFLNAQWTEIVARARQAKPGDIIYEDIPLLLRVLRDMASSSVEKIRVDHLETVLQMRDFANRYVPRFAERIEYYAEEHPIFDIYAVDQELQKSLERKVALKSGGYVVFDQTEAMTTIDVNTGSYVGHANGEQTIIKTNLEAVDTIARQVRLRNLGGIIIIDFIDMIDPLHQANLLQSLATALSKDSVKTEISELSRLGLVQMTRRRTRESVEHILCVPCPLCQQRGSIKSLETISYDILREIKRTAVYFSWPGFLVLAAEKVVNYLRNEEPTLLAHLETQLGKSIELRVESSYVQEHYDILPKE